jgi:hypothetical protein
MFIKSSATCLVADKQRLSVRSPRKGKSLAKAFHFVKTGFCSHIPKFHYTITANAAEFSIFDRIERHFFNWSSMTFKFGGESGIWLLRVP